MKCLNPKPSWKPPHGGRYILNLKPEHETKYNFDYDRPHAFLPCRSCPACAQSTKKDWSLRLIHESSYHKDGCVLTLTFDEENLYKRNKNPKTPHNWSVYKYDVSTFIKKLRTYINRQKLQNVPIKFYAAGEYGTKNHRPHYHIIIFGYIPEDIDLKLKSTVIVNDNSEQHQSQFIDHIWDKGLTTTGVLTPASAGYVAGYVNKKMDNKENPDIQRVGLDNDGNVVWLQPEFNLMSQGIGKNWIYDNYKTTFHNNYINNATGQITTRYSIPAYYIRQLEKIDPDLHKKVTDQRREYTEDSDLYQLLLKDPPAHADELARLHDYGYISHSKLGDTRPL